ncbi:LuxR C-terminal-related transcriptional regulator [Micromonospora sp. DT227]|uniref:helix-turn-helix transcriptional regulator n=1 Tax=Micromonospora sp. DT227 TaxID=3393433 RepID=UPI003CF242D9
MTDRQATLAARAGALRMTVQERILTTSIAGGEDSGLKLFAAGISAINSRLGELERATRSVVYNLQARLLFDPLRRERELDQRMAARGIQGHLLVSDRYNARSMSLIAACHPDARIGPVEVSGLVVDERLALFPGPLSPQGLPTAWLCHHPDLVTELCDLWAEMNRDATPILDTPGLVRLNERQLTIVNLLSQGYKDAAIARLLGVSARTVTGDISRILDALAVGTRWEAGLLIGQVSMPC